MTLALHEKSARRRALVVLVGLLAVAAAIFSAITLRGELQVDAVEQDERIWFSQFNEGATDDVPDWNDTDGNDDSGSSDERVTNSGYVVLENGAGITRTADATALGGLEDIRLEYFLGWETTVANPGELIIEWREQGGAWQNLRNSTIPGPGASEDSDTQTPASVSDIDLPAGANDTDIEIRFRTTITEPDNMVRLDNIRLSGNLIDDMIDSDGDGVFDQDDQCSDTVGGANVDSRGCSVDQYIAMLSPATANGGYTQDICAEANFSLVIDTSNSISESPELSMMRSELVSFISTYASGGGDAAYELTTFNDSATNPGGAGYQTSGTVASINSISETVGNTNTMAGINAGDSINGGNDFADNVMFIVTDGAANLPNAGDLPLIDANRWVAAANQAIQAANSARSAGFVVETVFVESIDSDMASAFGSTEAARAFSLEVMSRMGGGSFYHLGDFSGIAETLLDATGCEPVLRSVTIEKIVAGDEPDVPLSSVDGAITNHPGGTWEIDPVPGSTTLNDVSGNVPHVVSETDPGEGWTVEYQLADPADSCDELDSGWSTNPDDAQVPADEDDYLVCVRNTFEADEEPVTRTITIEKQVAGDEPDSPLTSVSGTIGNHSPGDWTINTVPGSVDIVEVSSGSHLVTETGLGAGWQIEYGLADSAAASCDTVDTWSEEPLLVPSGDNDEKVCILNTFFAEVPTRSVIVEKVLGGDDATLASVSGTISGHSPGSWNIGTVPGSTTIADVSVDSHVVTENDPGQGWTVEYAIAPSSTSSCDSVSWSTSPATVPAGEADVKVCVRNSFTELPSIEKTGVAYDTGAGRAQWDIMITNPSGVAQSVTIVDPIAVNIVGGTPDGCSGSLAGGLTCNVSADSDLTITVFKMVTQQCGEQTVVNSATAFVNGDTPIIGSPQTDIPTTVPGDQEFCEDLTISKSAVGWFSGIAGWSITLDNSESGLSQMVVLDDPGAIAEGDYPSCDLLDGEPITNVECELEVGQVLNILVGTDAPSSTCDSRVVENVLHASSTRGEPDDALILELEYEIFALLTVPGNPELCPATLTIQKYLDADGDFDDLINGPRPDDVLSNGWTIILNCDGVNMTAITGMAGLGTVEFTGMEGNFTNCTISEELKDEHNPVGFLRTDDDETTSGPETINVDIEISNGDHDTILLFNEDDGVTEPTETPTATATETGTATETASPSPTDDATSDDTPVAPDSGSGFGLGGQQGAVNLLFAVTGLLVIAAGASLFSMSRRRQ